MAEKAEQIGVAKVAMPVGKTFTLAVLAGAFIALGAIFATTAVAGSTLPFGVTRVLSGTVFSLGLVLVIVGGAELFTGNNLIVMAWASGRVTTAGILRNWSVVFAGNLVGGVGTAVLNFAAGQYKLGGGSVGSTALAIAEAKCSLAPLEAIALGVLCNVLVCLAVWLAFSARTTVDRVAVIVPPIAAFVAAGFEHSIANLYFVPMALLIKHGAPASFWTDIGASAADYPALTVDAFLVSNLLPVTIGNILGGSVLVGLVYWSVYLRAR
ncbi:MAG: formate transporter FocA [Proteobacteria bacterium]|nr:formate transporter FocA [Pseudomonadota bacterium]